MRNRLIVMVVSFIILLAGVLGSFWLYRNMRTYDLQIDVVASEPVRVSVYYSFDDHDRGKNARSEKPVATISSSSSVELKRGEYTVVAEASDTYQEKEIKLSVPGETKVKIDPRFTENYLDNLLTERESGPIEDSIERSLNGANKYSVHSIRLYDLGEWAGIVFKPRSNSNLNELDFVRVAAKKQSGVWEIMTDPGITLSTDEYPEIPREVLKLINDDQFELQNNR